MLLVDFMDATFALAVEDHTRINPLQGVEAAAERWLPANARVERVPKQAEVKQQSQQSMDILKAMLSNTSNSPLKKKPRRTR